MEIIEKAARYLIWKEMQIVEREIEEGGREGTRGIEESSSRCGYDEDDKLNPGAERRVA